MTDLFELTNVVGCEQKYENPMGAVNGSPSMYNVSFRILLLVLISAASITQYPISFLFGTMRIRNVILIKIEKK